jgi:hypothetical protein
VPVQRESHYQAQLIYMAWWYVVYACVRHANFLVLGVRSVLLEALRLIGRIITRRPLRCTLEGILVNVIKHHPVDLGHTRF